MEKIAFKKPHFLVKKNNPKEQKTVWQINPDQLCPFIFRCSTNVNPLSWVLYSEESISDSLVNIFKLWFLKLCIRTASRAMGPDPDRDAWGLH